MDILRFDNRLKRMIGDAAADVYTTTVRTDAMYRAVQAFSKYSPVKRRWGTGTLYADAAQGATSIKVIGGPFSVGDTLTLGAYGLASENVTVSAVAFTATDDQVNTSYTLTVSATAHAYTAGAWVAKTTLGFVMTQGVDTYALAPDFIRPDKISFDLAIGKRSRVSRVLSFYDLSYDINAYLSGVGLGQMTNFGPTRLGLGYPMAGMPVVSQDAPYGFGPDGHTFRFSRSQFPPILTITPSPLATQTLDVYYYGSHIPQTIMDEDMEALLEFALYTLYSEKAGDLARKPDWKNDVAAVRYGASADALTSMAQQHLDRFDILVRKRPYLAGG